MNSTPARPAIKPVLLLHGGAWAMPDDAIAAHQNGIRHALKAGWAVLESGGSALDAVGAAITMMEDDDTFDAGRGSFLTRDGRVQLDALMMSGADLRAGGVACVERLRNPIQAARLVLDRSPHIYFVGPGAENFAAHHGMPLIDNTDLVIEREKDRLTRFQQAEAAGLPDTTFAGSPAAPPIDAKEQSSRPERQSTKLSPRIEDASTKLSSRPEREARSGETRSSTARRSPNAPTSEDSALTETAVEEAIQHGLPTELAFDDPTLHSHDTVGAVALDADGNLAAGTSTGGTLSKAPGRVGDSSLIGCGCYADNESAAVSLTGWGEPIMKLVLGKWATDRVASGSTPQAAATDAIAYLHLRLGGHGGIILLGPDGQIGLAHNTPRMAWGWATTEGQEIGIELP